jgi:hypothetical protein
MSDWLQHLSPGEATFVGSLTGSAFGLLALLIGALFNAHLNRKRDDLLRRIDARSVATAFRAELNGLYDSLTRNADELANPQGDFFATDIAHSVRVMPHFLPKIGLLDGDIIRRVIDTYVSVDQHCELLLTLGGQIAPNIAHRRVITMPVKQATHVVKLNRDMAKRTQDAIASLDAFLSGRTAASAG